MGILQLRKQKERRCNMNQLGQPKKAVAYVRASTGEEVERLSLSLQEPKIREWCEVRKVTPLAYNSRPGRFGA